MTKLNVLKIIGFVKGSKELFDTKVVLGGPEVRNHVEKFLEHGADLLVLGEGEQTMLELVEHLDGKTSKQLNEVFGIAYKDGDEKIIRTPPGPISVT
jgi:radical SAM superfamily enzyme YgiQ (UPF0313 family)